MTEIPFRERLLMKAIYKVWGRDGIERIVRVSVEDPNPSDHIIDRVVDEFMEEIGLGNG